MKQETKVVNKLQYDDPQLVLARAIINAETNRDKLKIDRTIWIKSTDEKIKASMLKSNYKSLCKNKERFKESQTALYQQILSYKPNFNVIYRVSKTN